MIVFFQLDGLSDLSESEESQPSSIGYSVKVIDPNNKRNYVVKKWRNTVGKFKSVAVLHSNLKESFTDDLSDIPVDDIECGYIDPGHGAKGRQLWVFEKSDLDDMYEAHAQKKEIMIWFYTKKFACGKKRCASPITSKSMPNKVVRTTKHGVHTSKLVEVEEIVEKLAEKHSGKYSREQLNVWAHMLQLKKHDSLDEPPDKPFFHSSKRKNISSEKDRTCRESSSGCSQPIRTPSTSDSAIGISPGKRINLRSECVQQLDKWHQLLEKGAITELEYKETQEPILKEMKRL